MAGSLRSIMLPRDSGMLLGIDFDDSNGGVRMN